MYVRVEEKDGGVCLASHSACEASMVCAFVTVLKLIKLIL